MRTISRLSLALFALLQFALPQSAQAQKQKAPNFNEGVITYELKIEGNGAAEIETFTKGTTIQLYLKDSSSCLDIMLMGGLMRMQIVRNSSMSHSVMLLDIPMVADKVAVSLKPKSEGAEDGDLMKRLGALDNLQNMSSPLTFKGSKRIAKHKCRKGTLDMPTGGEEMNFTVYSTSKLRPNNSGIAIFSQLLGGFPLGFDITAQGMRVELTAKTVEKKEIPASRFEIPKGYTEKDLEEFEELFKGKMGGDKGIIGL